MYAQIRLNCCNGYKTSYGTGISVLFLYYYFLTFSAHSHDNICDLTRFLVRSLYKGLIHLITFHSMQ